MQKFSCFKPLVRTAFLGSVVLSSAAIAMAADTESMEDLKARVAQLEGLAAKEGLLPSGKPAPKFVSAMSGITLSGFVQASYFYNTAEPSDRASDGYLWNTTHNSFSINKVKVTFASKPLETDKWDAGFRASFIWGEDATGLNSGSATTVATPGGSTVISNVVVATPGGTTTAAVPGFDALREAYVELNVPIGTGLNIKVGELISLLNWESGDGGAANPNFSQGNQWWFTGNGPSAGIQMSYNFTDKVGLTVRADNGLFQGPVDGNNNKAFSASLGLKPTKNIWVNFVGWYSENEFAGSTTDVLGGEIIGGVQITPKFGTGFEFDYFNFCTDGGSGANLWSMGGWAWYDFTSKVGLAVRADYIGSPDGTLGPAVRPNAGIGGPDSDGSLGSLTMTLNYKPVPSVKIQPEIRYDYTSFKDGLDGDECRVIIGCGISYLF